MPDEINLDLFEPDFKTKETLLMCGALQAGFPSPAEDYPHEKLDLLRLIIKHPSSTFYFRVNGVSMINDHFDEGDIVVVDRSLNIYNDCVAVCFVDGEFTLKRVEIEKDHALLMPANPKFKPIVVTEENNFIVWGIVTYVIKKV